jgi:biotin carboxyl carrier protein
MEAAITAPVGGTVARVAIPPLAQVAAEDLLIEISQCQPALTPAGGRNTA